MHLHMDNNKWNHWRNTGTSDPFLLYPLLVKEITPTEIDGSLVSIGFVIV